MLTASWAHGVPGQHVPRLVERELKREPELSQLNSLGQEQHAALLQNNRTATQMFVVSSVENLL